MKRNTFPSYKKYLAAQKTTVGKRRSGPFFANVELERIADWAKQAGKVERILCHGARAGHEVEEFRKHFEHAAIIGTDLFPADSSGVIKHDFNEPVKEWIGQYDLIYSNSLDHARNPAKTLLVWMRQLSPRGHLFVQWTKWHTTLQSGDCFAATLHEYMD